YGLPPGTFTKTQKAWVELIHPEDRAEAAALVERAMETGLPVEGEWRVIWPDGSVHWLFGRWQVFKDGTGNRGPRPGSTSTSPNANGLSVGSSKPATAKCG